MAGIRKRCRRVRASARDSSLLSLLNNNEITCSICLDVINCLGKLPICSHNYCYTCILEWSKKTNICPICKRTFRCITKVNYSSPNKLIRVPDIGQEDDDSADDSYYNIIPFTDNNFDNLNNYDLNDSFIDNTASQSDSTSSDSCSTTNNDNSSTDISNVDSADTIADESTDTIIGVSMAGRNKRFKSLNFSF